MIIETLSILALVLIPPAYLLGNWQRGRGTDRAPWLNKKLIYIIWSIQLMVASLAILNQVWGPAIAMIAASALVLGLVIGNLVLFSPAWGKWFPQLRDTSMEIEGWVGQFLIDPLTSKVLGYKYMGYTEPKLALRYKTVAFSLRFIIFSVVKYGVLAVSFSSLIPLMGIILSGLVGPIYRLVFDASNDQYDVSESEKGAGLTLAVVDMFIILMVTAHG